MIQGQGLYSGPGLNSIQPQKQLVPPHSSHQPQCQQKLYSGQATPSKQHQQILSHSDINNQNHVLPGVTGPTSSTSVQAIPPAVMPSSNQQQQLQPQPHLNLVNQTQPTVKRLLQQNRQVNSDPPNKLQAREAQADLHSVNNSSQISTKATVPGCVDMANVISAASSASAPQWKAPEPVYDSCMPNHATQLGSLAPVSQGLGQSQSSGSLSRVGHEGGVQWSQQPLQLQPPAPLPPMQHQQEESAQQQSQQQTQLLQGGNNNLYVSPPQTLN